MGLVKAEQRAFSGQFWSLRLDTTVVLIKVITAVSRFLHTASFWTFVFVGLFVCHPAVFLQSTHVKILAIAW